MNDNCTYRKGHCWESSIPSAQLRLLAKNHLCCFCLKPISESFRTDEADDQ